MRDGGEVFNTVTFAMHCTPCCGLSIVDIDKEEGKQREIHNNNNNIIIMIFLVLPFPVELALHCRWSCCHVAQPSVVPIPLHQTLQTRT